MKKGIVGFFLVLIVVIVVLSQFSIQIGNVRIGKQIDLKIKQNKNFEESYFYQSHFSKENLVVINLWATWCKPCIKEMPELNSIKETYKKENVDFLSLSIDTDSIDLIKFNNTEKFRFKDITLLDLKYRNAILNTLEGNKTDKWITSTIIPVTYLIKNKKIVKKFTGEIAKEELEQAISLYK